MRFQVSDNAPIQEVPCTVFKMGEKRKLMATPDDYSDLVRVVKRRFNLPESCTPTFQSHFVVEGDRNSFEIEESAYSAIAQHINEIEVIVDEAGLCGVGNETETSTSANDVKGKRKAKDIPTPSPSLSLQSENAESGSSFQPNVDKEPPPKAQASQTLSPSSPSASIIDRKPNTNHVPAPSAGPSFPSQSMDPHDLFNEGVSVEYASPKKKNVVSSKVKEERPKPKAPQQNVFDVDVDGNALRSLQSSPSKSKSKSTALPTSNSRDWEESSVDARDREEDVFASGSKTAKMANKRVDEEGPATVKKEKVKPSQETASASSSRSNLLDRLDAAANEIPAPSLILTQDPYDGGASQSQTQPSDYDPRFRVTIYGPGEDEKAEFMTRKKHTIKKVLAGACKSFGIDPTRAKLQQIVVVPDEVTEELVSHFYDCDNSETVGKAGIESNSNLRVVLEGDGLEEEENGWD